MKGKNENHDLNNQYRDIRKFEGTLFRVLATMDCDLLQALIDDFGLEACDRDGRNILMNLVIEHGDELFLYLIERACGRCECDGPERIYSASLRNDRGQLRTHG